MAAEKEQKSFTADEVKSLIEQTTKSIFEQFGPVLQSIALTPEKLREAQKPYIDPMELARINHERKEFQRNQEEQVQGVRDLQERCSHKDRNGKFSIRIQHNFHDQMPRGICLSCLLMIEPAHWDWRPITHEDGSISNEGYVVQPHPLYYLVQQLDAVS